MATIKQLDEALAILLGDSNGGGQKYCQTITAAEFSKELQELSYNYSSNYILCDEQKVNGKPDDVGYHLQLIRMIQKTIEKALEEEKESK